jgi:magnesium transporter
MASTREPSPTQIHSFEKYAGMSPQDMASHLHRLRPEEAAILLKGLPQSQAAEALAEVDADHSDDLLAAIPGSLLSGLLTRLAPNRAADLIGHLHPARRREILASIPADVFAGIASLLHYPPDSAGGVMSNRFIALHIDQTVEECQNMLRAREKEETEDVAYLYVTDSQKKLVGVVSLRDLVFRRPERKIGDIMSREVAHVRVDDDQEKIAQLFERHHYLGLPVLEHDGTLVGVVPASEVIGIVQEEATEDMQLMVGLSGEEHALTPWRRSLKPRLLWLNINLVTAFAAAAIVNLFESTIAKWTVLAVFLPIIAGQGGNAGSQTLTVIIRGMAMGEMAGGDGRKALIKELTLGLLNGLMIGLVVGMLCLFWKGSVILGVVVAIAMVLNMIAAALSGVLVPFGLRALKIDPALASSIIVTTVTDVAGFFFFLGLAAMILPLFPV